jgi:K+-transporting ATPase ATPase C chain
MQTLVSTLRPALASLAGFTVVCGLAYPLLVGLLARGVFPHQATGSLITEGGRTVGSELVGQPFDEPGYFWSRRSATGPYDAMASGGTNHGPLHPDLAAAVGDRVKALRDADPQAAARVPVDLVTASGSGLDPHISPAAAYYQVGRVARARGADEATVRALVDAAIEERTLGILGERRVNALRLNRALDARLGRAQASE